MFAWLKPYNWKATCFLLAVERNSNVSHLWLLKARPSISDWLPAAKGVLFLLAASPLLYVPPPFFSPDWIFLKHCSFFVPLKRPQPCLRWDGSSPFAAHDVGSSTALWHTDVFCRINNFCKESEALASRTLQAAVSLRLTRKKNEKSNLELQCGLEGGRRGRIETAAIAASR